MGVARPIKTMEDFSAFVGPSADGEIEPHIGKAEARKTGLGPSLSGLVHGNGRHAPFRRFMKFLDSLIHLL